MNSSTRPWIRFARKTHPDIQVDFQMNLMKALTTAGVPVASSCRGEGICANCRLFILVGSESLSAPTESEKLLRERYPIKANQRISCQTEVCGDIIVDASYW